MHIRIKRRYRNEKDNNIYLNENIYFNSISNELYVNSQKVELTKSEKNLLILLLQNRSKTISYEKMESSCKYK